MKKDYTIRRIATIKSGYKSKFGIPRQSGLVNGTEARIVFEPEYANPDALRGLEGFSHIWLIWQFSECITEEFQPTVRPPRLGGNVRLGVFATRSPFRPNALGLSCVKLERIENGELIVSGADLMNGTPIYDIKPYIPYADCHPDAAEGFAPRPDKTLEVKFECACPEKIKEALEELLAFDPRPHYQNDPGRIYGFEYEDYEIKFKADGTLCTVLEINKKEEAG